MKIKIQNQLIVQQQQHQNLFTNFSSFLFIRLIREQSQKRENRGSLNVYFQPLTRSRGFVQARYFNFKLKHPRMDVSESTDVNAHRHHLQFIFISLSSAVAVVVMKWI
jgi:hypothetical protein